MQSNDKLIKIKAELSYVLFPKEPTMKTSHTLVLGTEGNTFGITKWEISEVIEGLPKQDKNYTVTVKGEFPELIQYHTEYTILGKEIEDPKYGTQYELLYINKEIDITKITNQKAILKAFLTDNQIQELYSTYENPLAIIESGDIALLSQVKGIKADRAQKIIDRFDSIKDKSEIYVELDGYGLTSNFIQKLLKVYISPQAVIKAVKEHPYQLIDMVDGVGFKRADEIALKGGLSPKSIERIAAYIKWFLEVQANEEGNSYVTAGELRQYIYNFFGGQDNIIEILEDGSTNVAKAIQHLQAIDVIRIEDNENKTNRRVYLSKIWELENSIAYHLKRLLNAPNRFAYGDWENKVKALEAKQGFTFDETQMNGIKLGLDKQVCLITGSAGCGKSSLVSGILAVLDRYEFAQVALAGKAAARLQEVTGQAGSTIHRLLGYGHGPNGGFYYNAYEKLPQDIIILDEISMVGGDIFLKLLEAIPTGSKLIILGDSHQLESISCLNLAHDMVQSPVIPSVELTTIHRQAAKSGIITSSSDIRNQYQLYSSDFEGVETRGELQDMTFDIAQENDYIRDSCLDWFQKWYNSELVNRDIMNIEILIPVKTRGDACVYNLNNDIQAIVNADNMATPGIKVKEKAKNQEFYYTIHKNDKVMCIKNNYKTVNLNGDTVPIFNGWTGIVKAIDSEGRAIIDFPLAEDTVVLNSKEAYEDIVLGYASTIHKFQGSDVPVIIGALDYSTPPGMLTCQLVYTLLTRAKKHCVLVAQNGALAKAIATNNVVIKRTFLPELLLE